MFDDVIDEGVFQGSTNATELTDVSSFEGDKEVGEVESREGWVFGSGSIPCEGYVAFVFGFKSFLLSRPNEVFCV